MDKLNRLAWRSLAESPGGDGGGGDGGLGDLTGERFFGSFITSFSLCFLLDGAFPVDRIFLDCSPDDLLDK